MMARSVVFVLFAALVTIGASAQEPAAKASRTNDSWTTCTFANGKQLSLRYVRAAAPKDKKKEKDNLEKGEVWAPGMHPMILFSESQSGVAVGGTTLPMGAVSLYVVPQKDSWTLVVNSNVQQGAAYDKSKDLGRVPMEVAKLPSEAKKFQAYFGHIAPQQCSLRLDYGQTRAFVDFQQK